MLRGMQAIDDERSRRSRDRLHPGVGGVEIGDRTLLLRVRMQGMQAISCIPDLVDFLNFARKILLVIFYA